MDSTNSKGAASQASSKKKPSFRQTRIGVLPASIENFSQLTVDAATKVALTAANVKLAIEIDAAGTRVFLADQRSGQMIGGPEDLSKLGGIRAFVTRERKDVSGVEIAREIATIAYRAGTANAHESPGYHQVNLESAYGASVRPLLLILERLEANRKKLEDNTNPELRQTFLPYLKDVFVRIKNSYFRHIMLITSGESKKGQLSEILFLAGVPEYCHTKFTGQNFVLERSQELARVLFPQDPSKGITLTVKEWASRNFVMKQGMQLLAASGVVRALLGNIPFIRSITKIDDSISLDDETNPLVSKMLKSRVHVMPPMCKSRYVTDPGSKMRGGWKFATPSMDNPQGAIQALSFALLRVYSANLQTVDLVGDYYNTIAPGSVSRAAVTPTNNLYVQWANSGVGDDTWMACCFGRGTGEHRVSLYRWIRMELRFSEKAEAGKALASALNLKEDLSFDLVEREVERVKPDPTDPEKTVSEKVKEQFFPPLTVPTRRLSNTDGPTGPFDLLAPLTAVEKPLMEEFQKRIFPSKKGKKKSAPAGANLTRLGTEAKYLIESVEELSKTLAERMTTWLRGFSDARIQAAASKLALAQFDELFIAAEADDESMSDSEDESSAGVEV